MSVPAWFDCGGDFVASCAHVYPSDRAHLPGNGTAAVSSPIFGEHMEGS
jgi:hypothetical protein